MPVAVIADIVGSRLLADRVGGQRILDDTIARVERDFPVATRPLRPTVGDEQQGEFARLELALAALVLLQLALPDDVECRFGVGVGTVGIVASATGDLHDGPAWWAARAAIETVHDMQRRVVHTARIRVVAAAEEDAATHAAVVLANAYLLARDQIVVSMNERTRRLAYGRCLGQTQKQLAESEGISQPAVSKSLASTGAAAVIAGFALLHPQGIHERPRG
ncbi:SatD family protein [uncultured Microbacterium sp.]|uniref:SatD family protein n=1 Tax=uncultured Microbacterium sp. TaxID=191216 RepID=UPI0035CB616E